MASPDQEAYCTLLMSDDYLPGAMVLAHSLRDNGTKKQLAALVTLDTLQATTIGELKKLYDYIIPVDRIVNKSPANLYLMDRLDLSSTFTKIALWKQTQFRRIVYLDSDIVALRAPDELFARDSSFAAVPDIGWPDCFNSGVLALTPNMGDYYALLALAQRGISFDGADQGLLNMHFRDWDRLSFAYNCTPSGSYQYVPAYKHFQSSINMVHFIGHDKPWRIGRNGNKSAGAYEELLARWWAVYDRHFREPKPVHTSGQPYRGKQSAQPVQQVQQYVKGETLTNDYGFSSSDLSDMDLYADDSDGSYIPTSSAEQPLSEKAEVNRENTRQGDVLPVPTTEQRRFSAPTSDWDPVREPPPTHSRPEAANFPNDIYTMSSDRNLYHAPKSYPEPPKDMWYQVPKEQPANERPKPIFPWEENQAKPTRVFAEDKELSPEPTPSFETDEETQDDTESPTTPTVQVSSPEPFSSYARTNAWDEVPEIERYIAALAQSRRTKIQLPHPGSSSGEDVLSPGIDEGTPRRRPSMKLTDFPTEFERPSLPVTPAPVRRPSFWGEERDAAGDLPGAEGVPKQEDWDPMRKLEELQMKQVEVLSQGPASPTRIIPDRERPESAVLLPTSEDTIVPLTSVTSKSSLPYSPNASAPKFEELDFGSREVGKSGEDEGVFGPTE
ncbi:glycogenin glucosyltransferase [Xylographa soralifera]|nr:glycogenin glucosyltransferase [Xylographa soralifera]